MRDVLCFVDLVLCLDDVVVCLDDVVLCFVRRRTSCFASTTRSAFRSRSGLLCAIRHAKYAASVSKFPCCVCPCLCSPSASLPWRRKSLPFPFVVPFSQEDHAEHRGPGLRLHTFDVPSSTCFWWRCKPSNRKKLRASRRFVLPVL